MKIHSGAFPTPRTSDHDQETDTVKSASASAPATNLPKVTTRSAPAKHPVGSDDGKDAYEKREVTGTRGLIPTHNALRARSSRKPASSATSNGDDKSIVHDRPRRAINPFVSERDRKAFRTIQAKLESRPVPDARQAARDFIRRQLGIDGDKYIVAHFKTPEARAQGKPDESMTLTDAVMQNFPGFTDQGFIPATEDAVGGLCGGGQASPSAAGSINRIAHSKSIGDFFRRLGELLWSRTGPGYVYNTFINQGNIQQTASEHNRPVDDAFGIYNANGKGFSEENRSYLTPSKVASTFKAKSLGGQLPYIKKLNNDLDAYWDQSKKDWPSLARYNFVTQARAARDAGKLTQADYELVMKGGAPGIPLNGPMTLDQLRQSSKSDPSVGVERLDINGYPATDIVRFIAPDKSEVVYIPGRQPPFESIKSGQSREWLVDEAKDPSRLNALLSHFSEYNKQDGAFYSGVKTALEGLAKGESWNTNYNHEAIGDDVFDDMRAQVEKRMSSDANMQTRNAWEDWRHTLNRISVMLGPLGMPVQFGTGLDQTLNGKTEQERRDGVIQVEDATLNIFAGIVGRKGRQQPQSSYKGDSSKGSSLKSNFRLPIVPKSLSGDWYHIRQNYFINKGKYVFGTDYPIIGREIFKPISFFERRSSLTRRDINIISGTHGRWTGNNWSGHPPIRDPALIEPLFYYEDVSTFISGYHGNLSGRIKVIDSNGMSLRQFEKYINTKSSHVILGYCFGILDHGLGTLPQTNPPIRLP
ncbi:dermonecrotic toxin domain-containing protein [Burkholderia pyrrocinia]|uniref:dermonecrotic toxin domain-containing protein n=1 Tax=Burkholderia pyrrocinia TaxID=60550 RepID=UPI00104492EC|nr:DUF6543 domain-containing protein [Burkholderia pyrrocinia]TDA48795.1 hypothetical protein EVG18_03515 [Burkholderia pyrrocinia]